MGVKTVICLPHQFAVEASFAPARFVSCDKQNCPAPRIKRHPPFTACRADVGQRNGSSSTIAHRSNSAPKNSLHRRATTQSLHQFVGGICAHPAQCKCTITQGSEDAFPLTSSCSFVQLDRSCAAGHREKSCCRGATGVASVPERLSERLAGFRSSRPTGHAQVVVDERHIHHFRARGGPRRAKGFYDSKAFPINDLYNHRYRSGRLGPRQRPSHYHARAS